MPYMCYSVPSENSSPCKCPPPNYDDPTVHIYIYIYNPSTRKYLPIGEFQACMGAYSEHYSSLGCYLMQRNKVCVRVCVFGCNLAYSVTLTDTKVKLLSDLISNVAATGVATTSVVTSLVAEGNSN